MASVVYANPFGSYIEGQSRGLEDAVRAGEAARRFRDSDINADFMKWYAPLRRQEASTEASKNVLGLNEGVLQNAGRLTALGEPGRQYFNRTLQNIYGADFGNTQARDPVQFQRIAGESSGLTPYGVYDPAFASVGHYGYSKRESLSPEEFEQQMTLRHGPNWQTAGAPGAPQAPSFDPFGAATGHIPGFSPPPAANTPPPQNNVPPYLRAVPPNTMGQGAQQPKSIWADERQAGMGSGGVSLGNTTPRVANPTGGF